MRVPADSRFEASNPSAAQEKRHTPAVRRARAYRIIPTTSCVTTDCRRGQPNAHAQPPDGVQQAKLDIGGSAALRLTVSDQARMIDALIQRLEKFAPLDPLSRSELRAACIAHAEYFGPRKAIFSAGEQPFGAYFVLSGFACRHLQLPGGRRPIAALLLPGDIVGMRAFLLQPFDHGVS
jgi:hypothetical protein